MHDCVCLRVIGWNRATIKTTGTLKFTKFDMKEKEKGFERKQCQGTRNVALSYFDTKKTGILLFSTLVAL
ncbi:Uncharacterized protein APZ42_011491 [Daphnia magna]|uniref:Uncharacterized protein n=1 Tax=Daphnia magna TaxID=35525 RepID=A0A0N8CI30_9CRUS|nr:Uncharacterized protein APZ42_011491 [Daphnia magna]